MMMGLFLSLRVCCCAVKRRVAVGALAVMLGAGGAAYAGENKCNMMLMKLKDGDVKIELFPDIAPNHVERIKKLAAENEYDNVVFHRVIDGFMAQTGDVQFGNSENNDYDLEKAGTGGSDLSDLKAEFSDRKHESGTLSMARERYNDNSANSQFFICFEAVPSLNGQYTVFGHVIEGMEFVDKIKIGDRKHNGAVSPPPDKIISFSFLHDSCKDEFITESEKHSH
jgi:cyclophilin family peptidyl-prolyl cis-trans isomerase